MTRKLFNSVLLLLLFSDQLIKILISKNMFPLQSIPIIKNIFHLTFVQNKGVAFGLLSGGGPILLVMVVVITISLLIAHFFISEKDPLQLPLALILAGSLSNLIDRMRFGYVIDYLDFRFWPVFNVADTVINIGIFLIIVNMLRRK